MPVSFVGVAAAAANTVDPPAHQAGDLLLCYAVRAAGDSTQVALASGWTGNSSSGATGSHQRLSSRIATAAGTPGGVWTNAQFVMIAVYRGCDPVSPLGATAMAAGTNASPQLPALTLQRDIGSSWAFGAWFHLTATNMDQAPAGMVNRASLTGPPMVAAFDSGGPVTSFAARGIAANASGSWRSVSAEIRREHFALAAGGTLSTSVAMAGAVELVFNGQRQAAAGTVAARIGMAGHAVLLAAPGRLVVARRRILRLPGRPLFWDAKRPEERDLFGLDLLPMLARPDGTTDELVSVLWTVPPPLVLHAQGRAGTIAAAEISGGDAGVDYPLDCLALTAGGRALLTRVRLPVRAP